MEENKVPTMNKKQLLKSVIIALVIGALVLITAVLPAEYNIDPLGTGKLLGFSKLYVPDAAEMGEGEISKEGPTHYKSLRIEKLGSPPSVPKPVEANAPPPTEQFPAAKGYY